MGSVVDEVSQLLWPGFEWLVLVVVPPGLLVPLVELDDSWCEEPCEGLKTAVRNDEAEREAEVSANVATELSATNDKGNELPEGENP